jgi:hypothetical protein
MKKLIYHIVRLTLVLIPAVLTVAPAMAQKPVPYFEVFQHDTIEFSVVDMPGDEYTWDFFRDSTVNFAEDFGRLEPANQYFVDGDYRDSSSVLVTNLDSGIYFLRVTAWDEVMCTNNLMLFKIKVKSVPEADLYGIEACFGDPTFLEVILTGVGPWDLHYTDGAGYGGDVLNLNGNPGEFQSFEINPLPITADDEIIIKEIWINYIKDHGTGGENYEPSNKARIVIYPIPTNSGIYIKED